MSKLAYAINHDMQVYCFEWFDDDTSDDEMLLVMQAKYGATAEMVVAGKFEETKRRTL